MFECQLPLIPAMIIISFVSKGIAVAGDQQESYHHFQCINGLIQSVGGGWKRTRGLCVCVVCRMISTIHEGEGDAEGLGGTIPLVGSA